ncbi:chromosome segregation protein SMC [Gordonia hongkongensis]|uniref:Chromosome partition protein Smc n=1 Tax=Gordonia hongkongensis TaxID=1701090 RepID=A0AAX3TD10_9ACTN|nr:MULTISPECIES: chromosome segregation protein SMC [Gordonia]OCW84451.1 chromosome segregation protein SMC [Nocardia farcinica]QIK48396.1 chromosome segregation protein SMC [Gordonia terrae]MBN0971800.1 chromosome segregation protein SMC [Gordonia sp. BP-119]MBN0981674.1 chromosome segregation protein SMC [Gordonia sp. BP-94]MDT0220609.1 chromosome segregation protein SMC [Gordonia sp. AC31]
MHLKSLTLKGFKSFASATTLRFEPGITCVVGPNGSGKSNVVDALTWVMGEQGAKALRGGKMQDVIFAGTSGRPPLGRAEVTLTIDNADGALPIEYSEVSITRRMFRDGAGEYEINGSSCRLMDVQELLSDSGIGREMHVIVGQGRLSAILESRPEDRRAFIEEAAGVLKHRKRKEKAVRKLDAMQANLARLNDLTAELRRQLKPLGRQAEVARRAQTVQADLRDARLRLAADDLVTRRAEMAEHAAVEDEVRRRQDEVAAELDRANAEVTEHEQHLAEITPAAAAANRAWFRLSALAERVDATRRVAAERSRYLSEPSSEASGPDPEELDEQALEAAELEAELTEGVEIAAEQLESAREVLGERESIAEAAEAAHLAAVRAIADRREGLARLEGQVDNLRTRSESVDAEAQRLTAAISAATERAEVAVTQQDSAASELAQLEAAEQALDEHHERCVAALNLSNERVATLQAAHRDAEHAIASLSARVDALAMGLERGDGGAWLLENAPDGLLGPMSELVTVEAGFETAIAGALGPAVDGIVTVDGIAAVRALAALKSGDGGRAALICGGLTGPDRSTDVALPDGARWAASVVDTRPEIRGAIDTVLADTVIVDDPAQGLELARRLGVRAVTPAGDRISAASVEGGSSRRPSTLEVQSAIDAATAELASTRRRVEELEAALAGALTEQHDRREAAEEALAALHESDAGVGAAYEQMARLGQEIRASRAEADKLTRQRNLLEKGREETLENLQELTERLRLARDESEVGTEMSADDTDRANAATAVGVARSAEMEARLTLRTAEERLASVRGKADSLRRAAQREREARERARRQDEIRRQAAGVAAAVERAGAQVSERLAAAVASAQAGRDELEEIRTARTATLDALRVRAGELTTTLNSLRDTVHRDEVARAQVALRIEQLEEQVLETFAMAPDDLIAEYGPDVPMPPSALEMAEYEQARERGEQVVAPAPMPYNRATQEARAKKAQKDLNTLGKVNPLALEEFAALEERYNFLSSQLEDVKAARKDLLDVVEEVDARILQVFTEAYADVEREFGQVFQTLFPGGEGRLVLTEPGDMLTTGIEVEARPPGKKVKRLSLLSGGEKSLTAVAMLVAIFRARPSPFYVMDEVEAALDDTNLRRLITLFAQLREKSQLIVITHQKPTMEVADALYGVSMRGDGITTVISQRMRGVNMPVGQQEDTSQ